MQNHLAKEGCGIVKINIMTDLEGVGGIIGRADSIGNRIVNPQSAGKLLAGEVNACVEGLVRGGAGEIVVWDGHGGGDCIDPELLHPAASLGTIGAPLMRVNWIDAGYAAAIQLGAHAMQDASDAYLSHSYDSHGIVGMRLNGEPIGEIGMYVFLAAYFGVPTVLVSGDRAACDEAERFLGGNVRAVVTKTAFSSRYSVINRNPAAIREELTAAAFDAVKRLNDFSPPRLPERFELEYRVMCPNRADECEKRGIERRDRQTVVFRSDDFLDLYAQIHGWAPGLHNRRYGIGPKTK